MAIAAVGERRRRNRPATPTLKTKRHKTQGSKKDRKQFLVVKDWLDGQLARPGKARPRSTEDCKNCKYKYDRATARPSCIRFCCPSRSSFTLLTDFVSTLNLGRSALGLNLACMRALTSRGLKDEPGLTRHAATAIVSAQGFATCCVLHLLWLFPPLLPFFICFFFWLQQAVQCYPDSGFSEFSLVASLPFPSHPCSFFNQQHGTVHSNPLLLTTVY